MSVNVSKFTKKKEGSTSVVVNNSNKGYSNTNNNYNSNFGLDRQLWNIHDTGQDITETPTLPALNVNGQINAGGRIHSDTEVTAPTGRFSYLYGTDIYGTNADISYITSEFITTDDLKVNNTAEIRNIISEHISTQYLDVTKSAHFAELIIDKIKSVGGSAVFSPADGFKIASEDDIIQICNSNGVPTNYWMLCWDGEDDRGATVNMWERNDQALCQNFNEATVGTSHNISNTYFWMLVFTAGTYNPDDPSDIMYDHGNSETDINQSSYRQETAYNSEGEKITFDTLKHYIVVYNSSSRFTDAERNTEYVRDGAFNPKAGNEVVMLGHRARLDEMNDSEYMKRQSAIYIAAYNSTIEPDLMAPLIAQYQGINDFDLSSHRTTHFAAGHNDIFGYDNEIRGSFKTVNGTDITDLNGVTYFIKSNKAYIPVTSDWSIGNNAFNISLDCMYISGDNGPRYVGNRNSNMRLIIRYSYNGTNYPPSMINYTYIQSKYTFDLRALILPNTNGYIDTLSFEIAELDNGQYNTLYQYNMPVIKQASNMPGDDAEFYKMNPIRELAQVDVEGNFALYLQYEVQHIIGNTITTADNTDYYIEFTIFDENNREGEPKPIPYVNSYFTYDKDGNPSYEKINVFGTYSDRSLFHDRYIEVKLIKNNGNVEVERRVIPITLVAGAMFSVTDSITSRVTASETTANTAYNMASQAVQTAQGFDQRVTKTETDISNQQDTITGLQTDVSRIQQTADTITSEITKISGVGGENLIVNSSFQIAKNEILPEKWGYHNVNTIITTNSSGSINYVNINNNINKPSSGDGKWRGIEQTTQNRLDTAIQDFYPEHIYCFSFYGKKNSTYGEISCFIHYLDSNGTHISRQEAFHDQTYSSFDLTDDWTRYCFIFKTPDENAIFSFNIMLEYYGNIRRNNESTIPVRDNDVDIMMPMLLDFGEATEERMDLYGLYRLNENTHVYDVWKNEEYNASQVPMWQGNSQDVSVSSSQILQTADIIRAQVGACGIDITNQNITLNGDTIVNGELTLNSNEGFNLNNTDGSLGAKIHGGEIPNISDWISSTTADNEVYVWDSAYFSNTGTSQQFTITRNSVELGYHQPFDTMKINYIAINCPFNISGVVKVDILDSDDSTILATKTSTIANVSGTRVYRATFSDLSYTSNQTARNYYIQYTFSLTGTPEINNYSFRTRISTTVTANSLVEIGSNGIATRIDSDDYMYMGGSAFEVRHGNNGLQVYNADGHIPASGQYGYGAKYYINNSGQRGWFPLNTPKIFKLSTSSFLWYEDDKYDMVITNYSKHKAEVTIYLPTIVWPGRVCYVRKGGISNVEVLTSSGYNMFVKQDDIRTSVTITNGDMLMFIYGGSTTWYVNKLPNP